MTVFNHSKILAMALAAIMSRSIACRCAIIITIYEMALE